MYLNGDQYEYLKRKFFLYSLCWWVLMIGGCGLFIASGFVSGDYYWYKLPSSIVLIYSVTAIAHLLAIVGSYDFHEFTKIQVTKYGRIHVPLLGPILTVVFVPICTTVPLFIGATIFLEVRSPNLPKTQSSWTVTSVTTTKKGEDCISLVGADDRRWSGCGKNNRWWGETVPQEGMKVEGTVREGAFLKYMSELRFTP